MCWLLSSEEIWSTSDFSFSQVTSVEKREPQKHFSASAWSFLGLGLWPRPQKCGLGFKKLFLGSLFSTSITWTNLKSDVDKFFLRVASTIFKTKYYFHPFQRQIYTYLAYEKKIPWFDIFVNRSFRNRDKSCLWELWTC